MSRLRLHQFNQKKPCFFCGAPGPNSKEHAPPKKFFEGTPCSSITVPACLEHNTDKSGSDNAIKAALLRGVDEMISKGVKKDASDAVRRSIEIMQAKYCQANRLVSMMPLVSDHPDDADISLPFLDKAAQLELWVKMLTAALLWSVTGTHDSGSDWANALAFCPSYLPGRRDVALTPESMASVYNRNLVTWRNLEDSGDWRYGWQPYPDPFSADIYRFDVCVTPSNGGKTAIFKHHFFAAHPYYVRFETSEDTISTMDRYLKAEADRLRAKGIVLPPALLPPSLNRKS
jgi:hypothetical protein